MTIATTDLTHLSEAKRALLAKRLKGRAETVDPDLPPAPTTLLEAPELRHAPYPVRGFVRERLRFAQPGGTDFRLFMETRHPGLDAERFRAAWHVLHQRYDALRSRVEGEDLVVAPPDTVPGASFPIPIHDARALPPAEIEATLQATRERMHGPGDGTPRPAMELTLIRLPDDDVACLFSFDQFVMDLASVEFLALRCRKIYDGEELSVTRLHVQDYRRTEDAWLASQDGARAAQHWDKRLAAAGPRLTPAALVPDAEPRFQKGAGSPYGYLSRTIPRAVWSAGRVAANERKVSDILAVQVLFTDLLRLASGQSHFAYEARGFQRLPFHREVLELLGQFSVGHPTGCTPDRPERFIDRVKAEMAQVDVNTTYAHFDAASRWVAQEPPERSAGKIVFTNTCDRFEEFVLAGAVPPLRWFGTYEDISQTLPDTALEYVLVENDGALEVHWFLNHLDLPPAWAERIHTLYCRALAHLCATPTTWDARCVFTAALAAEELEGLAP